MPGSTNNADSKRTHLTLQQKVLIIEKREREALKQDELGRWAAAEFGLPKVPTQPTISNILKHKAKLLDALRRNPQSRVKSVRIVKGPEFVEAIVQWIHAQDCQVTRREIFDYAVEKQPEFPEARELMLSDGWLSRILVRYGIDLNSMDEGNDSEKSRDATGDQEMEQEDGENAQDEVKHDQPSSRPPPASMATAVPVDPQPSQAQLQSPVALRPLARAAAPQQRKESQSDEPDGDRTDGMDDEQIYRDVREYYGHVLHTSSDLKTNAHCCSLTAAPPHSIIREILKLVPEPIMARYFGCGTPIPLGIDGLTVLDLGCGSGRDACALSALVGPNGSVTGVDMLTQQVDDARYYSRQFMQRLNQPTAPLEFVKGYIERLDQISSIGPGSIDLAVANFAISLSPDKERALRQVFRKLRIGGEFHFCDIYATRRLPDSVKRNNKQLHSEGLSGAFYVDDFRELCREIGFGEPRQVCVAPITINDELLARQVGLTQFYSITFRCFKVPDMEMRASEEDYGHVATYLGAIPGYPLAYELDATHLFETRRPVRVGGNTAAVLKHSWLSKYFKLDGDWSEHFGRFCSDSSDSSAAPSRSIGSASLM